MPDFKKNLRSYFLWRFVLTFTALIIYLIVDRVWGVQLHHRIIERLIVVALIGFLCYRHFKKTP